MCTCTLQQHKCGTLLCSVDTNDENWQRIAHDVKNSQRCYTYSPRGGGVWVKWEFYSNKIIIKREVHISLYYQTHVSLSHVQERHHKTQQIRGFSSGYVTQIFYIVNKMRPHILQLSYCYTNYHSLEFT